jgi:hypothetical protein
MDPGTRFPPDNILTPFYPPLLKYAKEKAATKNLQTDAPYEQTASFLCYPASGIINLLPATNNGGDREVTGDGSLVTFN